MAARTRKTAPASAGAARAPIEAPPLPFRIVNWIGIIDQLATSLGNRLLAPLDLPLPQFVMLNHFSHRPDEDRTVTAVAHALQQPQPGVTKTIQKLVEKGWLVESANPRDGRSKTLRLSRAGAARHAAAVDALMPALGAAFADRSPRDLERMFDDLDRLKRWLDAERD
ncbi:MAG: MarR family transcriptional regulator [Rhodospirillales bacterium]|nr:MAG: MarR family transcriptional regulator [Rhodospirillales bacterium]